MSGRISNLCVLTNFSSTQSMLPPVSGSAPSVASSLSLFFCIFTLKFTIGVGHPDIFTQFAAGFDMEH